MKILLVIPTLGPGGAERVMSLLASDWSKSGHSVRFILLIKDDIFYELPEDVEVINLNYNWSSKFAKASSVARMFLSLRREVKSFKPDCVVSFMERYNEYVLLATRGLNIPVYVSDRNNPLVSWPLWRITIKKILYRNASGIVAQTSIAKNKLDELMERKVKVEVIPNPVRKINYFPNVRRDNIILSIGRLEPQKGHEYLIRAFSYLDNKEWSLIILGEGSLRSSLEILVRELGLEDRVKMPGVVNDVDYYFARASIFAFPSLFEGFPNALCEALVAGVPCISTDCPTGPSDMIEDGVNGFLCAVRDVQGMADKLEILINDPSLRQHFSRQSVKLGEHLNLHKVANKWLSFMNPSA